IFLGKVLRVLPGMQAAFVDVGLSRAAFLYVGDIRDDQGAESFLMEEEADPEVETLESADVHHGRVSIQDLIKPGQQLLVQVAKDPLGTKGARITTHISLPGRHVVYMPTLDHVGVSRRITDDSERERLRVLIEKMKIPGGVIVRTAGEGAT